MKGIVGECERDSGDFAAERDALIVLMLYACGLRLAELVGIDRDDLSDDAMSLRVRGKGRQRADGPRTGARPRKDSTLPRPD